MLTASGELLPEIGGASVGEEKPRRSLYLKSFRNQNDTFLHGFDLANGLQSVAVRDTTTTPTQSLLLFNGPYALGRAKQLAQRLTSERLEPEVALRKAFRWTWGAEPTPEELESAKQFVGLDSGEDGHTIDKAKLTDLVHILFNSNRFLYVE